MTITTRAAHSSGLAVHAADSTPPLWRESLWPVEWMSLRMSSVYYGAGVPAGDGSPVVVVPGFLCSDHIMFEMYSWLRRVGYRPYFSGVGVNASCPAKTAARLQKTIARVHRETGRRVRLVGHSLGGIIARQACIERPDMVSQLVYMGSPIRAVHTHPAVVMAATALSTARSFLGDRCLTSDCECEPILEARQPLPSTVHHASIYTRKDGVVDWQDARERNPWLNHEVGGTHIGLVYNPRAYRALGDLLAEASDRGA